MKQCRVLYIAIISRFFIIFLFLYDLLFVYQNCSILRESISLWSEVIFRNSFFVVAILAFNFLLLYITAVNIGHTILRLLNFYSCLIIFLLPNVLLYLLNVFNLKNFTLSVIILPYLFTLCLNFFRYLYPFIYLPFITTICCIFKKISSLPLGVIT